MQEQIINIGTIHLETTGNCGYCEDRINGKWITTSFQIKNMKSEDYHILINRGWRRCGIYYYKPHTEKCTILIQGCKDHSPYTIRLDVNKYQPKYQQQKNIYRFQKYLQGGEITIYQKKQKSIITIYSERQKNEIKFISEKLEFIKQQILDHRIQILELIYDKLVQPGEIILNEDLFRCLSVFLVKSQRRYKLGEYGSNLIILLYHFNKQLFEQNKINIQSFCNIYENYLTDHFFSKLFPDFNVSITNNGYINFQSNEPIQKKKHPKGVIPISKNKKQEKHEPLTFQTKIVKAQFEDDSYEIYKKYNMVVHKSIRESKESYIDFLCLQALQEETITNSKGDTLNLGCHHIKYYIDNQLIAVGVVDIMPEGLSLVHFFYDPSFKKLTPGFIGSIKQIEYIKEIQQNFNQFKYYYMGIYIKNCSKMSYKGEFEPSELLCPIKYVYVPLNSKKTQQILNSDQNLLAQDQDYEPDMNFENINIEEFVNNEIRLIINGKHFKIKQINPTFQKLFINIFIYFVKQIGKYLSQRLNFCQF